MKITEDQLEEGKKQKEDKGTPRSKHLHQLVALVV